MPDKTELNDFFSEMSDVKKINQDKVIERQSFTSNINSGYRKKVAQSFGDKNQNFLTDGEVESVEPEEVLSFKLNGIQPAVFKKLRQGKYTIDYHLDLHRKTVAEARDEVFKLLRSASHYNFRTLLITHGKGLMSTPPARLKSYINHWLRQVDIVLGFHSANDRHGGTGSVYVHLKKPETPDKINQAKYD
jgi:DNA-nicking Smr family endonuclease